MILIMRHGEFDGRADLNWIEIFHKANKGVIVIVSGLDFRYGPIDGCINSKNEPIDLTLKLNNFNT